MAKWIVCTLYSMIVSEDSGCSLQLKYMDDSSSSSSSSSSDDDDDSLAYPDVVNNYGCARTNGEISFQPQTKVFAPPSDCNLTPKPYRPGSLVGSRRRSPVKLRARSQSNPPSLDGRLFFSDLVDYSDDELIYHQPPKAADREAASRLAKRLFNLEGFNPLDVPRQLCKKNDFSQLVAKEFVQLFDFYQLPLDQALRQFLNKCAISEETPETERFFYQFSCRYIQCNATWESCAVNNPETCQALVYSIMLLNSELHGRGGARRIATFMDFQANVAKSREIRELPQETLQDLFHNVKTKPITWPTANDMIMQQHMNAMGQQQQHQQPALNLDLALPRPPASPYWVHQGASGELSLDNPTQLTQFFTVATPHTRRLFEVGGQSPYLDIPAEVNAKEYMRGYLARKWIRNSDGKSTVLGKRCWKLYFVRLRDLVLYLYKDAASANKAAKAEIHYLWQLQNWIAERNSPKNAPEENNNLPIKTEDVQLTESSELDKNLFLPSSALDLANESSCASSTSQNATPPAPPEIPQPEAVIRIAHSLASKATDYRKKPNVFHLRTKEGAEYLFQVSDMKELDLWVDKINFVAALLSAPPMASACSSNSSEFHPPLLPNGYTKFNMREQLEDHQRRLVDLERELADATDEEETVKANGTACATPNLSRSKDEKDNSLQPPLTNGAEFRSSSTSIDSVGRHSITSNESGVKRRSSSVSQHESEWQKKHRETIRHFETELNRYKTYSRLLESELVRLHHYHQQQRMLALNQQQQQVPASPRVPAGPLRQHIFDPSANTVIQNPLFAQNGAASHQEEKQPNEEGHEEQEEDEEPANPSNMEEGSLVKEVQVQQLQQHAFNVSHNNHKPVRSNSTSRLVNGRFKLRGLTKEQRISSLKKSTFYELL